MEVVDLLGVPLRRLGVPVSVVRVRGVTVGEKEAVDEAVGVEERSDPEGVGEPDVDAVLVGGEGVRDDAVKETDVVVERVPERLVVPDTKCEMLRDPVGERVGVTVQLKVRERVTVPKLALPVPKMDSEAVSDALAEGDGGAVRDGVSLRVAVRLALQLVVTV